MFWYRNVLTWKSLNWLKRESDKNETTWKSWDVYRKTVGNPLNQTIPWTWCQILHLHLTPKIRTIFWNLYVLGYESVNGSMRRSNLSSFVHCLPRYLALQSSQTRLVIFIGDLEHYTNAVSVCKWSILVIRRWKLRRRSPHRATDSIRKCNMLSESNICVHQPSTNIRHSQLY